MKHDNDTEKDIQERAVINLAVAIIALLLGAVIAAIIEKLV